MIRRSTLRPARSILVFSLIAMAVPYSGPQAQERSLQDRLDHLERDLSMRELTGRVEDAANGVDQLRRRLEQINGDIDLRLSQGQGLPRNLAPTAHASAGITDANPASQLAMRGSAPAAGAARARPAPD